MISKKRKKRMTEIDKRIAQLEKEVVEILGPDLSTAVKRRSDGVMVWNTEHPEVKAFLKSNQ